MPKRATSAEDDEESVGQISGGEEPEIETTEGDGLRRLSRAEAPQLVGESGEEEAEKGGDGEEREEGGQQGGGGEEREEEDSESEDSGGGGGNTDPLDDESDASVLLDELDESHAPFPGSCTFGCLNDLVVDCECECELCMFQYKNQDPPNEEKFDELLGQNFGSTASEYLRDPQQRHFRERRPYDYTQESESQSCTQMIPWDANIRDWTEPCPNTHQGTQGRYKGRILPCDEVFCGRDMNALDAEDEEEEDPDQRDEDNEPQKQNEKEPWQGLPDDLFDETHEPKRQYVCEKHIRDSKAFFHMGKNLDNLYNAHLIRYCKVHEAELQARHRGGARTCTCWNVDFTRWQCRSCFQTKVEKLQRHFRRRVNPKWRGKADTNITDDDFYQRDWRKVRRMLQRLHPCLKGHCGRPRLKGLARNEVLDCRCCGGYVVQPLIVQPLRRSARLEGRARVVYAK